MEQRNVNINVKKSDNLIDIPQLPFRYHVLKESHKLVIAALGYIAAGAWNNAVQALFNHYYGNSAGNYKALLIYAVAVSLIAILTIVVVGHSTQKIYEMDKKISTKLKQLIRLRRKNKAKYSETELQSEEDPLLSADDLV
eukprot:TRINITY_DN11123_c0_g1_i1.p1 TRINITY_DN11123_c0_g1~~TRINITY_DN11123_c0_g1_i1.p1  ORF type:complete len:140 (+),score=23.25 TRINITY_DN11123_c0_g1_i1:43-462(+)